MNPALPRPDELPIPAPWWVFHALLLLTFLLHALAMNVLLGGSFLAALGLSRGRPEGDFLARRLLRVLPVAFAATITLGVAPLLFTQVLYGHFLYASSVLIAWPWLSVVALALVAYTLSYRLARRAAAPAPVPAGLVWAQFALLLAIAFVLVNNMTLALDPSRWHAMYAAAPGGTNLNLADPQVLPRLLHMAVGAVAVAALFAALHARSGSREAPELSRRAVRGAVRTFLWATLLQFPLGVIFLLTQPDRVTRSVMGGSALGTAALALGVLLALHLVVSAFRALRAEDPGPRVPRLAWTTLVLVASMVLLRDDLRRTWLAPHFRPEDLPSAPQWGVLAVFLGTLLGGAAVLVWLVRAWVESERSEVTAPAGRA